MSTNILETEKEQKVQLAEMVTIEDAASMSLGLLQGLLLSQTNRIEQIERSKNSSIKLSAWAFDCELWN